MERRGWVGEEEGVEKRENFVVGSSWNILECCVEEVRNYGGGDDDTEECVCVCFGAEVD